MQGKRNRVISWDRKVTLTLAGSDAPRVTSVETFPAGRIPAGYEANSLGAIRTERTLEVPSSRKDRQYLLRIHYSEKLRGSDHAGVRFHESTATLVEKNEDGRVIREKSVYRDEREEPVDEPLPESAARVQEYLKAQGRMSML